MFNLYVMILTISEYNCELDELLELFACAEYSQMINEIWRVKSGVSKKDADLIWLFVFALNSWDHDDSAVNYLTEQQMMDILSRANSIQR